MNNVMSQAAEKQNTSRKRRKIWQRAVRIMAMVVVFCTTYALILPAITMQSTAICGKEEHKHSDECYELVQPSGFACELPGDAVILHQHDASCVDPSGVQICTLAEATEHIHGDVCYTQQEILNCAVTHSHTDACYTESVLSCTEPSAEEHIHEASCYQTSLALTCGREEVQSHTHDAACFDAQGTLICVQPQVVSHAHSDICLNAGAQTEKKLICAKEEHEHSDSCYPLEEDAVVGTEYHCGFDSHIHDERCYAPDGTKTCTIPEHTHDTLCLINHLDLTADLETQEQWEATMQDVELTGVWADDLVAIAESQLGYMESNRNCILYQEELLGYTRYGAWYGNDYGKWDDMFVSFCLNYAEIDEEFVPRESDTARWINVLSEKELYREDLTVAPVPGDLVFIDTNEDEKADHAGIVAELLPENEIRIIAGDTKNNCVAYETYDLTEDRILGFCDLPENPNPQPGKNTDVSTMLAELPDADQLQQTLQAYQLKGDKSGFEAELKDLISKLETISTAYEALSTEQKAQVTGTEKLTQLLELCTTVIWQEIPALTTDEAYISDINETAAQILSAQPAESEEPVSAALHNLDSVTYQFTAETKVHDGESTYGDARVKVELVLPLTADKAAFDTEAMTWLEESKLTIETRTIGEEKIPCQVLTGIKHLQPTEGAALVIPGSFTETVKVNVLNAAHSDQVFVLISAAMEQSDWNGTCWLHQIEEKQTLETTVFTVFNPAGMDEQQLQYETFKATIDGLAARGMTPEESYAAADQVQDELDAAYRSGKLSEEQYRDLSGMALFTLGDPNTFAESAIGNFWKTEVPTPKQNYTPKVTSEVPSAEDLYASAPVQASTFSLRSAAAKALDSNSQVKKPGGSNSKDTVYVSKTIEGTSQENVFDITLQIVTHDEIKTVYDEPDMAVVIVTDISQTMNSKFTGETKSRYKAAMDSAEEFIDRFQQQAGAVSKIGYVAFNTHAHKIFDLQTCDTVDKAKALATEMRNDTDLIMDPNQDGSDADYKASHDRFTNIEGGLKMAMDMLATAGNKNKFIVFLSDGFPTTYLKNNADSNTTNYAGYDPYTSSGSNGTDGVFYDAVMGVHCDYGTSYSDTAAIKAREMAKKIKNQGIDIFAIGVDVAGQTIKEYHDDSVDRLQTASTVERRNSSYSGDVYEIGHWDTTSAFENWLKGSATTGIGSGDGYYYSSTDTAGLHDAYDAIFEKIKILNGASSHLDWVVSDPMPGMGVQEMDNIEFIGFYGLFDNILYGNSITAELDDATKFYNENTVTFDDTTKTISWDLKKSFYSALQMENGNEYQYQLKYRVRLQNEESNFVESTIYDTNDVTSMGYRLIEVNNGVTVIGDRKYIEFPIPAVQGYLSELNFLKLDPAGNAIEGAKFVLSHDVDKCKALECSTCHGEGITSVSIDPQTCISDDKGVVNFKRIPSGHVYKLEETEVPVGYEHNGRTYQVTISYDGQDIAVCDMDGKEIEAKEGETEEWSGIVRNKVYYELPHTGSTGTSYFTFGGVILIGAAALMYIVILGRKNQRGGKYSR